jgi:RNA polymerase sigma factor (sigma-70 family)
MMDSIEKLLKDSNIVNIMNSVANRYSRSIDRDEIESIKMITLWKCIDKYDPTRGAKFTSYLYQQLSFALKNELKKKRKMVHLDNIQLDFLVHTGSRVSTGRRLASGSCAGSNIDYRLEFDDVLTGLPEDVSNILKQRYMGNMTMVEIAKENGYSRETARRRLKRAVKICKKSNGQPA